jgi:argininosuccinate lyase
LVNYAAADNKTFGELKLEEFRKFSPLFDEDVLKLSIESSLAARGVAGGTAPSQVKKALAQARNLLSRE